MDPAVISTLDGSSSSSSMEEFRHFDSVPLANDHHYIQFQTEPSNNSKIIMKEWNILENNLPSSIYVQVYETRIDLLRAVIIGSAGTPYEDGLFFFDIFLPPAYPNEPPHVHYRSHGYYLNPNLYPDGYLCLSLINTWPGQKQEKWSNGSTLLQLLVSIQGLVLNSRPYFNEPSYSSFENSKQSEWIKASNSYNENAFILSCQTMQMIMQHPPQNFEGFVEKHFRQRAAPLLAAIDDYQQGVVAVGTLGMTAASSSTSEVGISSSFKTNLGAIQGHLELVFAPFGPFPRKERATNGTFKAKEVKKKGFFYKFTSSLKKVLTCQI